MYLLPVLDLLNGLVVRGLRGRRNEYRPVVSRLVGTSDPLTIAQAFRDQLGLTRIYVADLDAILHQRPNHELYDSLSRDGFTLLVDAGLRNVESADAILAAGAAQVVAGLETWPTAADLACLCGRVGAERVIFSVDLKNGEPLGDLAGWHCTDPFTIAMSAVQAGVEEMIVLDLALVGAGEGVSTIDLCRQLLQRNPQLRLITGGGVRDVSDLLQLSKIGIHGVLVASALHDGKITRADVDKLSGVITTTVET